MLTALTWHLRSLVGLGAIFTALSELWFYPLASLDDLAFLVAFYALSTHVALMWVMVLGGRGWRGAFSLALVVGFLVEGVPVQELFAALPLTIVWTSMAWHGVLSGLIGVYVYRWAAAQSAGLFALANLGLGAGLGLWGAYFWGAEPTGLRYFTQMPVAWALFVAGHLCLPVASHRVAGQGMALAALACLCAAAFAAGSLRLLGPVALVLPALLVMCHVAARGARGGSTTLWPPLPRRRYWMSPLIPCGAAITYAMAEGTAVIAEANVAALVLLGPVSLGLTAHLLWRGMQQMRGKHEPA